MTHACSVTRRVALFGGIAVGATLNSHSQVASQPSQLVGHWRTTVIIGDAPMDRNLVLKSDGSATRWAVTAQRRDGPEAGNWSAAGNTLVLSFGGQVQESPYAFHEGQLVFPNIPNRRRFWSRV